MAAILCIFCGPFLVLAELTQTHLFPLSLQEKKHAKFIGFARMHKEQSANFCLSNLEK